MEELILFLGFVLVVDGERKNLYSFLESREKSKEKE